VGCNASCYLQLWLQEWLELQACGPGINSLAPKEIPEIVFIGTGLASADVWPDW